MKNNNKLGAILAVVGILTGLLIFYLLAMQYNLVIDAKTVSGRMDEATSVTITYAVLGWIGITAGAIAAGCTGFLHKENWAWLWGAVATTIQLAGRFLPDDPGRQQWPAYSHHCVFLIACCCGLRMLLIGGVDRKIIALAFVAGLAYVLTYIDGVAPISKFQTTSSTHARILFWNGMYVMRKRSVGGARRAGRSSSSPR